MCNKSESITEIAKALVKFNSEVKIIEKDAKNPHFKNQYASLDNIIDEVRPILTKHGLSVMQFPGGDGEVFTMTTMLIHESGEWIESQPIVMKPVKNDPQGIGSCATYARRYSLTAFLTLNTGDDDDGNGASHAPQARKTPQEVGQERLSQEQAKAEARNTGELASEPQVKMLNAKAGAAGYKVTDKVDLMEAVSQLVGHKVESFTQVLKSDVQKIVNWLESQKASVGA